VSELRVVAERAIGAPATLVYRLIADFDRHHPQFLPPAFSDFQVEQGGVGAGTVHSFRMTAGRGARSFRMRVEEPDPGRGADRVGDGFVDGDDLGCDPGRAGLPGAAGDSLAGAGGVGGLFERLFAPRALRRLYADELERLDRYARTVPPG
jgi:hypothetical protein